MKIIGVVSRQLSPLPPLDGKPNPQGELNSFSIEGLNVLVPRSLLPSVPAAMVEVEAILSVKWPERGTHKRPSYWLQGLKVV